MFPDKTAFQLDDAKFFYTGFSPQSSASDTTVYAKTKNSTQSYHYPLYPWDFFSGFPFLFI